MNNLKQILNKSSIQRINIVSSLNKYYCSNNNQLYLNMKSTIFSSQKQITPNNNSTTNLNLNKKFCKFNKAFYQPFSEKADEITLKRLVTKYTPTIEEQNSKF